MTRFAVLTAATAAIVVGLVAAVSMMAKSRGPAAIEGRVVHAMTGDPAVGVTVVAQAVSGTVTQAAAGGDPAGAATAVQTDSNAAGQFTFEALPPGRYTVQAEHANAFGAFGQTHPGRAPAIVPVGDRTAGTLLVPLWPGSEISGTIRDERDRPLPDTAVRLIPSADEAAWKAVRTDDEGRYHAARLWPGQYRVVVPILRLGGAAPPQPAGSASATFLTTFAPDTPDPGFARLVKLGIGAHQRNVDVRMQTAPAARLAGAIEARPVAGTFFLIRLFRSPALDLLDLFDARLRVLEPGGFVLNRLPRASYTLEVERKLEGSDAMVYWPVRMLVDLRSGDATVRVRFGDDTPLDTSVDVDASLARRVTTIQGQVRGGVSLESAAVIAFPVDRDRWVESGAVPDRLVVQDLDAGNRYAIIGLPPGEYFVRAVRDTRLSGWPLPYVLAELAEGAARLTLDPGARRQLDLDLR